MSERDTSERNRFGQPVGFSLGAWKPPARPAGTPLAGQYCSLEKLDPERHAADLHAAYRDAPEGWTYLPVGPFEGLTEYTDYLRKEAEKSDPLHYAILDSHTRKPIGTAALMRIDPANGVIEVGYINYSTLLQRTRAGTEAMYLLMRYVFDELGYRRYEWKCHSLNAPSRRAAERYGFRYEGIFRQAVVHKGRNRDTAWYSVLDREWPAIRAAFETWLAPSNFDASGGQHQPLRIRTAG